MRVITMIVIVSILLVISIIDFKIKIIPNQLNVLLFISGIWSGFVFQEVTFLSRFLGVFSVSIPMFILAILCSGGVEVSYTGSRRIRRHGSNISIACVA